ncbi:MAG: hypothetical protein KGQ28_04550 [Hyphomicrobiales bacterium]|nr:hypothetical protein [Hyphomicrobiales bacterium]
MSKIIALIAASTLAAVPPALAQTIVDGSQSAVPPAQMTIILRVFADATGLGPGVAIRALRPADGGDDRIWCGQVRVTPGRPFLPFYVNTYAGAVWTPFENLSAGERQTISNRISVFGCK